MLLKAKYQIKLYKKYVTKPKEMKQPANKI